MKRTGSAAQTRRPPIVVTPGPTVRLERWYQIAISAGGKVELFTGSSRLTPGQLGSAVTNGAPIIELAELSEVLRDGSSQIFFLPAAIERGRRIFINPATVLYFSEYPAEIVQTARR